MIKERLQEVRDFIEKLPSKACDMTEWQHPISVQDGTYHRYIRFSEMKEKGFACGTAGCIGGWTEAMVNHILDHEYKTVEYIHADEYLGLDEDERYNLFMTFPSHHYEFDTWKDWMLARLDTVIHDGHIKSFYDQPMIKTDAK